MQSSAGQRRAKTLLITVARAEDSLLVRHRKVLFQHIQINAGTESA
jgi:hypothetical protein